MDYKIKTIGVNHTNLKDVYIFSPFISKSNIFIIPKKSGILKFMLIQNKNIINISIYNQMEKIDTF